MSGRVVVSTSGFKALEAALAELPKATARNVLKRTMIKAAEPIRSRAEELAPRDTGNLKKSIIASTRLKNKVGNAAYSAAIWAGLGKGAALQAMRAARRANKASFAELYIGPVVPDAFYAHFLEFGTQKAPAQPFLRPAWDARKDDALSIMRSELGNEIIAAARRIGRSKKQPDNIKFRASIAAMMAAEVG